MHVRGIVKATIIAELATTALVGLLVLAMWLVLGDAWVRDIPWGSCALGATGVAADYFRKDPPNRRRGVQAGLAVLLVLVLAAMVAADQWLPSEPGGGMSATVGLPIALPVANGVFAFVAGPPPVR
ncbi:hypothetical protein ACFVFS_04160 [Kitasatospora sp. NPDC057692]|uniref:hypothetical protein n=1 Tax=Kitasatospora sp. NPDC057692 TaxID=3346215 RepID=UPI00368E76B5